MDEDRYAWERHLPQSLDDRVVSGRVKALFDQAQLHVENFYVSDRRPDLQGMERSIADVETPYLTSAFLSEVGTSISPLPCIKHCLSYMIAQAVLGDAALLPAALSDVIVVRKTAEDSSPNSQGVSPS